MPTPTSVPAFTRAYIEALQPGDRIVLGSNSTTVFQVRGPVVDGQLPTVREDGGQPAPIGHRRWTEVAKLTPPPFPSSKSRQRDGYGYVQPSIPVPILTDEQQPMRCRCGAALAAGEGSLLVHASEVAVVPEELVGSHKIGDPAPSYQNLTRCQHCGGVGHVTYTQHAWYDEFSCARCGGSTGYGIGD
jgi:hypothetical protein